MKNIIITVIVSIILAGLAFWGFFYLTASDTENDINDKEVRMTSLDPLDLRVGTEVFYSNQHKLAFSYYPINGYEDDGIKVFESESSIVLLSPEEEQKPLNGFELAKITVIEKETVSDPLVTVVEKLIEAGGGDVEQCIPKGAQNNSAAWINYGSRFAHPSWKIVTLDTWSSLSDTKDVSEDDLIGMSLDSQIAKPGTACGELIADMSAVGRWPFFVEFPNDSSRFLVISSQSQYESFANTGEGFSKYQDDWMVSLRRWDGE